MIRSYLSSDKSRLLQLLSLNVPKYFDAEEVNDLDKYLDDYGDCYFVMEIDGIIIGGAGYSVVENLNIGHIRWIFLHPEFTNNRHGKELMAYCETILLDTFSVHKIIAETSQMAYRFFEKNGFSKVKTKKDYWGAGLDLYYMEKIS